MRCAADAASGGESDGDGDAVATAALWTNGIAMLREGVEGGKSALVRQGSALLQEYFRWVRQRHGATRRHFVSAQVAWHSP